MLTEGQKQAARVQCSGDVLLKGSRLGWLSFGELVPTENSVGSV
jgi:hypothetical protein